MIPGISTWCRLAYKDVLNIFTIAVQGPAELLLLFSDTVKHHTSLFCYFNPDDSCATVSGELLQFDCEVVVRTQRKWRTHWEPFIANVHNAFSLPRNAWHYVRCIIGDRVLLTRANTRHPSQGMKAFVFIINLTLFSVECLKIQKSYIWNFRICEFQMNHCAVRCYVNHSVYYWRRSSILYHR